MRAVGCFAGCGSGSRYHSLYALSLGASLNYWSNNSVADVMLQHILDQCGKSERLPNYTHMGELFTDHCGHGIIGDCSLLTLCELRSSSS